MMTIFFVVSEWVSRRISEDYNIKLPLKDEITIFRIPNFNICYHWVHSGVYIWYIFVYNLRSSEFIVTSLLKTQTICSGNWYTVDGWRVQNGT